MSNSSQQPVPLPAMPENALNPASAPYMPGDPVPWFRCPSDVNADFNFPSLGGRYVVLSFLGSLTEMPLNSVAQKFLQMKQTFNGINAACVFVSCDPRDAQSTLTVDLPAMRLMFDFDRRVSRLFGLVPDMNASLYTPTTFILDPRLRVLAKLPIANPATHVKEVMDIFGQLAQPQKAFTAPQHAPVLMIPHVFEPDFCRMLIKGYEENGGKESGYMTEKDGKTVLQVNHDHKRRSDWIISQDSIIREIRARFIRRILPEIMKAHQFEVTIMERYLVACYEDTVGGHFKAHRDNTTKGTAHRRFACSVNLNSEDYEGGELTFPEFGPAHYKPPTGGACVFSCSLLHEATPVTRGKRYVFLPFLYDNAAAKIRDENLKFVNLPDAKETA